MWGNLHVMLKMNIVMDAGREQCHGDAGDVTGNAEDDEDAGDAGDADPASPAS